MEREGMVVWKNWRRGRRALQGLGLVVLLLGAGAGEAADAWRALAALLPRLAGWELAVLGPDRGYERLLPAAPASAVPVLNGGRRCRLLRWRLG